jgi:endonuclease/exonuclease/phosphatase family metal-dependent hydrolase
MEAKRVLEMEGGKDTFPESYLEVLSEMGVAAMEMDTTVLETDESAAASRRRPFVPRPPRSSSRSFHVPDDESKVYNKHAGKACFPGKGAVPLEANHDGDYELPGWPTYNACKKACDDSFKCKAFTRSMGTTGKCWLRQNVDLYACLDQPDVETYSRQSVEDDDPKCIAHTELTCGETVGWTFGTGKRQSWAEKAYGEIRNTSGVSIHSATVEDVQRLFYCGAVAKAKKCELPPCTCSNPPCDTCGKFVATPSPPPKGPSESIVHEPVKKPMGYKGKDNCWVGESWCEAQCPAHDFSLNVGCDNVQKSLDVKVLSYNLFWWHLFGVRGGADRMAGRLVEEKGERKGLGNRPWDLIGFQECDNMTRIMEDSRISGSHQNYNGTFAVTNAWDKSGWKMLSSGFKHVSEDSKAQYYGKRTLVYARLMHRQTKKTLIFLNFHGALPVNADGGGACGGEATAYNILRVISEEAQAGDAVILVGDFNAEKGSHLLNVLSRHLKHEYQGRSFNGVDNFFTNRCVDKVNAQNLGNGGSDHDALGATFRI